MKPRYLALFCIIVFIVALTIFSSSGDKQGAAIDVVFIDDAPDQALPSGQKASPLFDAARLAVEEINASGGLLGRPVELSALSAPPDAAGLAKLAQNLPEKVSAFFGCETTACRAALAPLIDRQGGLRFHARPHESMAPSPNVVHTAAAPNQQLIPGVRWALDNLGGRVFYLGSTSTYSRQAGQIVRDQARAARGLLLGEIYLPPAAAPDEQLLLRLRAQLPDAIISTLDAPSSLKLFAALRVARLEKLPILSFTLSETELTAIPESAIHPELYAAWSYFQSIASDSNRRFVDAFKARYGKDRVTSDSVAATYSGVLLWAQAVREAGSAEPAIVRQSLTRQSVPGPAGVVAFDGSTGYLWKNFHVGKADASGQFTIKTTPGNNLRPVPFPAYRSRATWLALLQHAPAGEQP